ncbi:LysR substrate-binding domain-containing protein [Proteus sp. ZN5]|uniref:LysR substrate-binding domain-containing protein n=1 Tax=Proteus sp. ZN5 TaxID=2697019 RepID=UPI0013E1557D|nr:LysR substrate-binding domain-containing protein [Proteus sp. ZN5]QIG05449.1 LysR family transcriptional regulator [Proteus sp. ZN5]
MEETKPDALFDIPEGLSSNSGETLRRSCIDGEGIVCLFDFILTDELQQGRLIELFRDKLHSVSLAFSAFYYSDRVVRQRIQVFIDSFADYLSGTLKL